LATTGFYVRSGREAAVVIADILVLANMSAESRLPPPVSRLPPSGRVRLTRMLKLPHP